MKKRILKFFIILFLLFFIIQFPIISNASYDYGLNADDIKASDKSTASISVGKLAGATINFIKVVSVAIAVIMLIVLAVKYMLSAPNDKAEIKKHAVVYVVGAIVLFSASGVLEIIQKFANNIQSEGTNGTNETTSKTISL